MTATPASALRTSTSTPRASARAARDVVGTALVWLAGAVVVTALAAIVVHIARAGGASLSLDYVTSLPERAGLAGGIMSVIATTLLLVVVALAVAAPVGLLAAVLLFEATRTPRTA